MTNAILLVLGLAVTAALPDGAARAQPPAPMSTQDFIQAAAGSDQYEIEAAEVATIQSRDPRILAFARRMIQDHTRTGQALRQAALASGRAPPPMALADDGSRYLAELQGLSEPDFDKAYVRQQVLAHRAALVTEQGYAAAGEDPNVRRAAEAAVPMIQSHLDAAQAMQP